MATFSFDMNPLVEEILNVSGLGLLILDKDSVVVASNGEFQQWLDCSEQSLLGLPWLELPFESLDQQGSFYMITGQLKQPIYLQHWHAVIPSQPNYIVHFFRKTTLNKPDIAAKAQLIGLPQRPNWIQFLDYEVSRSRRYDNPLAVLKIKLICFDDKGNITNSNKAIQIVNETLRDQLRWADMIGQSETGEFLIILPETSDMASVSLKHKIAQAITEKLTSEDHSLAPYVVIGESHWQKGDTGNQMLDRARLDMIDKLNRLMAELDSAESTQQ
ncbi:MAG: diguanylate cyclase [Kangiellaceae bacterium]|jgi:diguanylate cyclase (GGDEF)-like protein|nr:diguanylate cyclase [Kangiellaceae bacterium]